MVKKEDFVYNLFIRYKPVKILVLLREGPKYATVLSKEVDITYSHTIKLLDLFNDMGLVEFEKKGRIKLVKLTSTGEDLARVFDSVVSKLSKLKSKSLSKK